MIGHARHGQLGRVLLAREPTLVGIDGGTSPAGDGLHIEPLLLMVETASEEVRHRVDAAKNKRCSFLPTRIVQSWPTPSGWGSL